MDDVAIRKRNSVIIVKSLLYNYLNEHVINSIDYTTYNLFHFHHHHHHRHSITVIIDGSTVILEL